MHYSFTYQNERGVTQRSEFLGMASDEAALAHAKLDKAKHFIVEVWKGDQLLSRTIRDQRAH